MEQDALNSRVRGDFAPLSPRYNFMGDFFLTGLEAEIAPDRAAFRQSTQTVGLRIGAARAVRQSMARRGAVRARLFRLGRERAVPGMACGARPGARTQSLGRRRCGAVSPPRCATDCLSTRRFRGSTSEFRKRYVRQREQDRGANPAI